MVVSWRETEYQKSRQKQFTLHKSNDLHDTEWTFIPKIPPRILAPIDWLRAHAKHRLQLIKSITATPDLDLLCV